MIARLSEWGTISTTTQIVFLYPRGPSTKGVSDATVLLTDAQGKIWNMSGHASKVGSSQLNLSTMIDVVNKNIFFTANLPVSISSVVTCWDVSYSLCDLSSDLNAI